MLLCVRAGAVVCSRLLIGFDINLDHAHMHRQAARAKKALAAPAKKTLALTTVSLPQYLALFTAAGVSLLSGASVVHNILQPDLVRN